jgi:hypothetical protein
MMQVFLFVSSLLFCVQGSVSRLANSNVMVRGNNITIFPDNTFNILSPRTVIDGVGKNLLGQKK